YQRCRDLAMTDKPIMKEIHAALEDEEENTPAEMIDQYVANEGWQHLANKFGPQLFKDHPSSVLGYMADEFFRLSLIAHLSRSKALRQAARSQPELLEGTEKVDDLGGFHRSFLATMLNVLDDESLLVLHVEQQKGFDVTISGIADNFQ